MINTNMVVRGFSLCALLGVSGNAAQAAEYRSDSAKSRLEFSGKQAGAPFTATVKSFTATASFDANRLADSRIQVEMDLRSVNSQDSERDNTMRGADFFDVVRYSKASYVTKQISKNSAGFAATGSLTLRGVSRDVPIQFNFNTTAGGATLVGRAQLKRLDFGVGQGEWKSTEWVGNDVEVKFSLVLSAPITSVK